MHGPLNVIFCLSVSLGYTAYNVCSFFFFLHEAVYCRAEGIISRHTIDVVRSTARGQALKRDSQDLVDTLPS